MPNRTLDLNGTWRLAWHEADPDPDTDPRARPRRGRIDAPVPGDVHEALLSAGRIEEPTAADNVTRLGWIRQQAWWYERTFTRPKGRARAAELVFHGLDYFADVWLNGRHLARHANMFRPLRVDVTGRLADENTLLVRVHSHLPRALLARLPSPHAIHCGFHGARATMSPDLTALRPYMRKMQCSFGWDWTQDLCTCGLWRGVELRVYDRGCVDRVQVRTDALKRDEAALTVRWRARNFLSRQQEGRMRVGLYPQGSEAPAAEFERAVLLAPGATEHAVSGVLSHPRLWWPAGYGPQNLYEARCALSVEGRVVDEARTTFGVRAVEIDERPRRARGAYRFTYRVNGRPVYLNGANWVPANIIPSRVTPSHYRHLLSRLVDGHMNYLRVWGGGFYEDPVFYRLCDELGIAVWQDFMFSCAEYPDFDEGFVEEVRREAEEAVLALCNHPCILTWCGNNEIDQQRRSAGARAGRPNGRFYGERLFYEVIPEVLDKLGASAPYRPSSGCVGAHARDPEGYLNPLHGATHLQLGHLGDTSWVKRMPSFLNEWYVPGAPPVDKSMQAFLPDGARAWENPVWRVHDFRNLNRGFEQAFVQRVAGPRALGFDEACYFWRVQQAETVREQLELQRAHRWENSGSCFWMFDDAWPSHAWSLVDYYGREKPSYYAMKRASQPVLPVALDRGREVEVRLVTDPLRSTRGEVRAQLVTFTGETVHESRWSVRAEANSAVAVGRLGPRALRGVDRSAVALRLGYYERGRLVSENRKFLDRLCRLKLPQAEVRVREHKRNGQVRAVTLRADTYARNVALTCTDRDLHLAENWFDLFPGRTKTVRIDPPVRAGSVSVDWQNRPGRPSAALRAADDELRVVAGASARTRFDLFNPTDREQVYRLEARAPDSWRCEPAGVERTLDAGASATVPVRVHAPLAAARMQETAHLCVELSGSQGAERMRIPCAVGPPLALEVDSDARSLTLTARNRSETELRPVVLAARWEDARQGLRERRSPVRTLAPGAETRMAWRVGKSALPWSVEAEASGPEGAQEATRLWLPGGASRFLKRLHATPLGTEPPVARPVGQAGRARLTTAQGYRIDEDSPSPPVRFLGGARPEALVFFHYSAEALRIDALVLGERVHLAPGHEPVYFGTSLELALAAGEEPGFEAVVGLRRGGRTEAALRCVRGRRKADRPERHGVRLDAVPGPAGRAVAYRAVVPWGAVRSGLKPKPGRTVRYSLAFIRKRTEAVKVHDGIQGTKDPGLYGTLRLG